MRRNTTRSLIALASLAALAVAVFCIAGPAAIRAETTATPSGDAKSPPAAVSQAAVPAPAQKVRLMDREREALFRRLLPKVADETVQDALDDPSLILYTELEMPRAYQSWSGPVRGIHDAYYNISANRSERYGNGNREFPWNAPAGTHRTENVSSFRFVRLPRGDNGRLLPIVWFRQELSGDYSRGYSWRFPAGAMVGEVLMMRHNGADYAFELRVRTRRRDDWAVDVFRPFPRAEDLVKRIQELRPEWQKQPALAALVERVEKPGNLPVSVLADHHSVETFRQRMGVFELPSLKDDKLVAQLLTATKFRSALGTHWIEGANGMATAAPTTKAPFHVVPANYDAGFIEVDRESCMRCHNTVNHDVNDFEYGRDWYGRIRGSDGIFSFHPFEPWSISGNGGRSSVQLRNELVEAGVLQGYTPKKHDPARYAQVPQLRD